MYNIIKAPAPKYTVKPKFNTTLTNNINYCIITILYTIYYISCAKEEWLNYNKVKASAFKLIISYISFSGQ